MKQSLELKTLHTQPASQSLIRSYTKLSPRWTSAMVRRPLFGMTPGIIDALADRFSALHSHCKKNSLVAQVSLLLECRIPSSWCPDTHLRRLRNWRSWATSFSLLPSRSPGTGAAPWPLVPTGKESLKAKY